MIQYNGPYAAPQIFCDHCGKIIENAREGNYQWRLDYPMQDGETPHLFFTHKACCDAFETAQGGSWAAIGLEALPFFLAHNLHVPWKTARAHAHMMSRL
jgi:hypothetical protein